MIIIGTVSELIFKSCLYSMGWKLAHFIILRVIIRSIFDSSLLKLLFHFICLQFHSIDTPLDYQMIL
jgi:hypothetical protein